MLMVATSFSMIKKSKIVVESSRDQFFLSYFAVIGLLVGCNGFLGAGGGFDYSCFTVFW
jgi:hypothetical protein